MVCFPDHISSIDFEVLQLLNLLSPIVEFHIAQIFTAVKFTAVAKISI